MASDEPDYFDDFFEEVPGDCRHMPGNPTGRKGCLLCNPKEKVVAPRQQTRNVEGSRFRRAGEMRTLAEYDSTCVACDDEILAGVDYIRRIVTPVGDGWAHEQCALDLARDS